MPPLLLALALGALACATEPPELSQARAAFERVAARDDVRRRAGVELHDAETAIDKAEATWHEDGDYDESVHLSYVAGRRAELALLAAERRALEEQVSRAPRPRAQSTEPALPARRAASMAAGTVSAQSEGGLAPLLERLSKAPDERGVMTLGDVNFRFDSDELKDVDENVFALLARFLGEHPDRNLLIEGHTDDSGVLEYNFDLSRRRAESVKQGLVQAGAPGERILTVGYGPVYPIDSNATPNGRARNRRVAVVVLSHSDAFESP